MLLVNVATAEPLVLYATGSGRTARVAECVKRNTKPISDAGKRMDAGLRQNMTKFHEEPECSDPPRKKKRKKLFLEARYIGDGPKSVMRNFRIWHRHWARYATERDRQNALDGLNGKIRYGRFNWEYRIPEE